MMVKTKPRDLYDVPEEEIGLSESNNDGSQACQENEEMTDASNSNVIEDDANRTLNNPEVEGEQVQADRINPEDDDSDEEESEIDSDGGEYSSLDDDSNESAYKEDTDESQLIGLCF